MRKISLDLYEHPYPLENINNLWVDIDEDKSDIKAVHKYNKGKGEWEPYLVSVDYLMKGEGPEGPPIEDKEGLVNLKGYTKIADSDGTNPFYVKYFEYNSGISRLDIFGCVEKSNRYTAYNADFIAVDKSGLNPIKYLKGAEVSVLLTNWEDYEGDEEAPEWVRNEEDVQWCIYSRQGPQTT